MKEISSERNNCQAIDTKTERVLEMGSKQQKEGLTNKNENVTRWWSRDKVHLALFVLCFVTQKGDRIISQLL